jgi:hypothetical protein
VKHFHGYVSIIPRLTRMAGFELGPGMFINTVLPEAAAEFLRNVKSNWRQERAKTVETLLATSLANGYAASVRLRLSSGSPECSGLPPGSGKSVSPDFNSGS